MKDFFVNIEAVGWVQIGYFKATSLCPCNTSLSTFKLYEVLIKDSYRLGKNVSQSGTAVCYHEHLQMEKDLLILRKNSIEFYTKKILEERKI